MREYILTATAIAIATMLFVTSGFGQVQATKCGQGNTDKNGKGCPPAQPTFTQIYSVQGVSDGASHENLTTNQILARGELFTGSSSMIGATITKVTAHFERYGNPLGLGYLVVSNGTTGQIITTLATINQEQYSASSESIVNITLSSGYVIKPNTIIGISWYGSPNDTTNYIDDRVDTSDPIDGVNSYYVACNQQPVISGDGPCQANPQWDYAMQLYTSP